MWLKLLLIPVILYVAVLAIVFFAQTSVLFPAGAVPPPGPPPPGSERLTLTAASGETLHGLHVPPTAPGETRLLILGFGGNAWNAEAMAAYLHDLYPEADIVAFHYRGYAPSEGGASARALEADAPRVHDLAVSRLRPERTVAVGFSIGGGVAAALAARRPLDGLILVTPFDSLANVVAGQFRWLPVRMLWRHPMEPAEHLRASAVPVALIAGERDTLIPPAHAEALRKAAGNVVFSREIAGAGHNDIYGHPGFRQAMREALAAVLAG